MSTPPKAATRVGTLVLGAMARCSSRFSIESQIETPVSISFHRRATLLGQDSKDRMMPLRFGAKSFKPNDTSFSDLFVLNIRAQDVYERRRLAISNGSEVLWLGDSES